MMKILIPLLVGATLSTASAESIVAVYDLKGSLTESGMTEPSLLSLDLEATRPLTLFEMELHANVSKYLVLSRFLPDNKNETTPGRLESNPSYFLLSG